MYNTRFLYRDDYTKNFAQISLYHFETKVENFDLQKLDFTIPKITIDGFRANLKQGIVKKAAKETKIALKERAETDVLKVNVGELKLSKIHLDYTSESANLKTVTDLASLTILFNAIDLEKQIVDINEIRLNKTSSSLALTKKETLQQDQTHIATDRIIAQNNWQLKLNTIKIIHFFSLQQS